MFETRAQRFAKWASLALLVGCTVLAAYGCFVRQFHALWNPLYYLDSLGALLGEPFVRSTALALCVLALLGWLLMLLGKSFGYVLILLPFAPVFVFVLISFVASFLFLFTLDTGAYALQLLLTLPSLLVIFAIIFLPFLWKRKDR